MYSYVYTNKGNDGMISGWAYVPFYVCRYKCIFMCMYTYVCASHTRHDGANYMDRRWTGYIYLSVFIYKNMCEYMYVYVCVYAHTGNDGAKCADRKWAGCLCMSIYVCEYM